MIKYKIIKKNNKEDLSLKSIFIFSLIMFSIIGLSFLTLINI